MATEEVTKKIQAIEVAIQRAARIADVKVERLPTPGQPTVRAWKITAPSEGEPLESVDIAFCEQEFTQRELQLVDCAEIRFTCAMTAMWEKLAKRVK